MARIRSLKIGFFQNEILSHLTPHHRLLFQGLWLIADREGRLEDRPKRIEAEIFPYEDVAVAPLLADLTSAGFLQQYTDSITKLPVIQVVNFLKHQRPHIKEAQSLISPCVTGAPTLVGAEPGNFTAEPAGLRSLGSGLGLGNGLGDLGDGEGIDQDQREDARAPFSVQVLRRLAHDVIQSTAPVDQIDALKRLAASHKIAYRDTSTCAKALQAAQRSIKGVA